MPLQLEILGLFARPDEALLEFESLCLVAITADFPYLRIAVNM
jgi:hypothetical protein